MSERKNSSEEFVHTCEMCGESVEPGVACSGNLGTRCPFLRDDSAQDKSESNFSTVLHFFQGHEGPETD